jgi:UDP-GlcNAc:undecaprenyl-phosphate GlcNAc-1-phosphate transferase
MNRVYILAFLIALLASFLLTPYVKKLAFKIGALDRPNKRKVHHKVMPRLGGLAIYCGFLLSVLCTMHISRDVLGLLLGGTVIMIVGVIDDKYQLPAKVKLLGQILAACVLVLFDIKIEWLNNPWGGYFYLDIFLSR